MLTKLSIQNYALIDDISIDFSKGLTTITGETGAGKSILLGGLGLILGNRADSAALMNPEKKCIIEGEFDVSKYPIKEFFSENDLDYENLSIIRRELLPSGKSRAFINDTPVRLKILSELQNRLIDIHSQHQTLQLTNTDFQFQLIDAVAGTENDLVSFRQHLQEYNEDINSYEALKLKIAKEKEQYDYHLHLYEELEKSDFLLDEQEYIEQKVEKLSNVELIQQNLSEAFHQLTDEERGLLTQLYTIKTNLSKIKSFSQEYKKLSDRLESTFVELNDIEVDLSNFNESISHNPLELENLNNRLQSLFDLYKKHQVSSIQELQEVQQELEEKIGNVTNASTLLNEQKTTIKKKHQELSRLGKQISNQRKSIIPNLQNNLENILKNLGIPEAQFDLEFQPIEVFSKNGIDTLQILFSANKGNRLGSMKQVASGGELSRIMLAFKAILAQHSQLPTIIFDEIDTGVSGEIAIKMANIMKQMSKDMQVISITHLPQIAAKGSQQMKVFKNTQDSKTHTEIKLLSKTERVNELAEMLGGKNSSETAINHAKQLLQ